MKQDNTKCIWTGKKSEKLVEVELQTLDRFTFPTVKTFHVNPEHKEKLHEFNQKLRHYGRSFVYLMIAFTSLLVVIPLILAALPNYQFLILPVAGIITTCIGILITILPFSTPETVKWLGLRRAIKVTRILGFITIIMGLIILIFLA